MNQHGGYGDGNPPQWGQGQAYGYPPIRSSLSCSRATPTRLNPTATRLNR